MRTNNGAIQLSRSIYDSEIWRKPSDWLKIWIYLLGQVNFKDNNDFKRGENFFRYEVIALECGVSYNTVVKCIKYLKLATQVQVKKTTRGAIISIINYCKYQDLSNYGNTEATQKQHRSNRSTNTIIEEGNKENNDNNIISKDITKQEFGNEEINNIHEIIKQEVLNLGLVYKKGRYERERIKNILTGKDYGEICELSKMTRLDFTLNILRVSTKLDFWNGKVYNAETIYKHYPQIYNEAKRLKENKNLSHKKGVGIIEI